MGIGYSWLSGSIERIPEIEWKKVRFMTGRQSLAAFYDYEINKDLFLQRFCRKS